MLPAKAATSCEAAGQSPGLCGFRQTNRQTIKREVTGCAVIRACVNTGTGRLAEPRQVRRWTLPVRRHMSWTGHLHPRTHPCSDELMGLSERGPRCGEVEGLFLGSAHCPGNKRAPGEETCHLTAWDRYLSRQPLPAGTKVAGSAPRGCTRQEARGQFGGHLTPAEIPGKWRERSALRKLWGVSKLRLFSNK